MPQEEEAGSCRDDTVTKGKPSGIITQEEPGVRRAQYHDATGQPDEGQKGNHDNYTWADVSPVHALPFSLQVTLAPCRGCATSRGAPPRPPLCKAKSTAQRIES